MGTESKYSSNGTPHAIDKISQKLKFKEAFESCSLFNTIFSPLLFQDSLISHSKVSLEQVIETDNK